MVTFQSQLSLIKAIIHSLINIIYRTILACQPIHCADLDAVSIYLSLSTLNVFAMNVLGKIVVFFVPMDLNYRILAQFTRKTC